MRQSRLHLSQLGKAIVPSLYKLVIPVVITVPFAFMISSNPMIQKVLIVMAGMPTSVHLIIVGKANGWDMTRITSIYVLTLLLCPVTLTLVFKFII